MPACLSTCFSKYGYVRFNYISHLIAPDYVPAMLLIVGADPRVRPYIKSYISRDTRFWSALHFIAQS